MDADRYRDVAERLWPDVQRAFNYPLLRGVRVVEADESVEPAAFRWEAGRVVLSAAHLDALEPTEADVEWLVEALLKHEVGHYALFPRELSRHLRYLQRAEEAFGEERGYRFYALYADVCDELRLFRARIGGEEVLDHRRRVLEAVATDDDLPSVAREARRRVQRLVLALYGETFDDLSPGVNLPDDERTHLDRLLEIDYLADDPDRHERNVVRFGRALEAALGDLPGRALRGLASPEDRGNSAHERPFSGDEPRRIPEAELDRALSDALADERWTYDRLTAFLERRAEFEDPRDLDRGGAAGLDRGDIERHDDQVAFFRRWAADFPVYVTDAPTEADETALYRSGRRSYEVGDPHHRVAPFASLGVLGVPGVSKVDEFEEGLVPAPDRGVPDLLVGIDSSGSMPRPDEESVAVLAAFVLAANYNRNGAAVGGYNFSGGVAFLPPGRHLDALHSLLCARWGGGTVLDRDALTRFVDRIDDLEGVTFSEEVAHDEMLDREVGDGERGGADDWPADADVPEAFAGLDHVLVTDGDVANEAAVADFVRHIGERSRTFVLLTDASNYERWAERDLTNTLVYAVGDEADLVDLAVGIARDRASGARERANEPNEGGA